VPGLLDKRAAFVRAYEATNYIELDRAQATLRYGAPVAVQTVSGDFVRDEDGKLETVPSPILAMSEEAWAQSGHKLRLPKSPTETEILWALFPDVFEQAENLITQLLALVLMPNQDVKRYARDGSLDEMMQEAGDELLDDALGDELLEVAAAAGEVIDDQLIRKARALNADGRLGKLGSLIGMEPTTTTSSPGTPTPEPMPPSSSDSPEQGSEATPT
jgi:hypothetical protein